MAEDAEKQRTWPAAADRWTPRIADRNDGVLTTDRRVDNISWGEV